jgi:hypothetical protein
VAAEDPARAALMALTAFVAVVALVAPVAFVALSAVVACVALSACLAFGTLPSFFRLTCVPVIVCLRRRLPDRVPFLISLSPLTSLLAAIAVPEAARINAITATTIAPDGLYRRKFLICTPC